MRATRRKRPPHRGHAKTSKPKLRCINCAQDRFDWARGRDLGAPLAAGCVFRTAGAFRSGSTAGPVPTRDRQAAWAPSTPSYKIRLIRGRGVSAAGRQVDADLRVVQATTMAQHLAMSRLPAQIGAFMLSTFAALALALAALGVYGLVRYTVARRTREVGIRMALGADAGGVARLLATSGVRLVLIGATIGVAASLPARRASRADPLAALRTE